MTTERWQAIKSILAEALEHESPSARNAVIDRSCAADPELLREIESFLAEATPIDPLEECAERLASEVPSEDLSDLGRRVGAYVITREIGRGGMGTIYLAARADGYFEKEVAIKVLNRGAATEDLVRRFRAEREVLARLDHPNIARLMDAGTMEDGRPYFVMEYVEGLPITRYVTERALSVDERLSLFVKIAAAVETAHRNSVIHRDLKPSNILVNHEGEPKLLDFGIAKTRRPQIDPLEITSFKQQRLTPMSASPEQVKGESVTASTDIYTLGVVLYELLTGVRPHRFATSHPSDEDLVEVICHQTPARPSQAVKDRHRRRELRGDLDAIVLRSLQKSPKQRYVSVAEFAEDIRAHLARKPIRARSTGAAYRFRTIFSRDRRTQNAVAAILLIFAALVPTLFFRSQLTEIFPSERSDTGAQTPTRTGIAVLPFDSLVADKENSYFADGVQEAILTNLANVSALKVISRGSVSRYRDGQRNERDVGRALGVAYVLEGSIQKTGDRVRVDAHLVDTRTAATIWAQQYDRKLDDLFGVESEVAQAIVSQLRAKLSPNEKAAIEARPTADMLAYDFFLRGRESLYQNNYRNAVRLLEQAISRDPQFALAHALLAQAHLYIYRFSDDRTATRLDHANEAAETALRIAPKLAQSHLAKAQYFYHGLRDYEHALSELSAARSFGGEQAELVDLSALIERRLGHWHNAIRDGERAAELDPQNPFVINEVVESYLSVRRFADADRKADKAIEAEVTRDGHLWAIRTEALLGMGKIEEAKKVIENSPEEMVRLYEMIAVALYARDFARANQLLANAAPAEKESYSTALFEGVVARAQGDIARAKIAFQCARGRTLAKLSERPNDPELISNLGLADAGLGNKEAALREAKEAVQLCPTSRDAVDGPSYQTVLALVYAWLGDQESAMAELEKTVKLPRGPSWGDLQFSPFWDGLRTNQRFNTLLAEAASPPVYN